jgi:hypothetical protein
MTSGRYMSRYLLSACWKLLEIRPCGLNSVYRCSHLLFDAPYGYNVFLSAFASLLSAVIICWLTRMVTITVSKSTLVRYHAGSYAIIPIQILALVGTCYWLQAGFGLRMGFTENLLRITLNNCGTFINLHTLQMTATHTNTSLYFLSGMSSSLALQQLLEMQTPVSVFTASHRLVRRINYWWPSPAESFLFPTATGFTTIFSVSRLWKSCHSPPACLENLCWA